MVPRKAEESIRIDYYDDVIGFVLLFLGPWKHYAASTVNSSYLKYAWLPIQGPIIRPPLHRSSCQLPQGTHRSPTR